MDSTVIEQTRTLQRKQAEYASHDEVFSISNETYKGQQYSHVYFARLHMIRTILHSLVPLWKPNVPVCNVLGLEAGKGCIIVGTLYKHMKLKPTILDEYAKERTVVPLVKPSNFMHQDDYLVLEDESGRVKLAGNVLSPSMYVTGVVIALHGSETSSGDFLVTDMYEAGLPPQISPPILSKDDKYVVLTSGLSIGSSKSNPLLIQLLVDHIVGHLGDEKEQGLAAEITRVVIAGNSVELSPTILSGQSMSSTNQAKMAEPIKELDIILSEIAAGVDLDIMPGPNDPANYSLPQQPLNNCLFPGSRAYNTFNSCSNPHCFEIDNISFLGTSGQNISDMEKYCDADDEIEYLERTLKWRNLAPTAPNTLGCYPFTDRDPFVIEKCPHVYFAGNQAKFGTKLLKGAEGQIVRLVAVPSFCDTKSCVVLNLRNLDCHVLTVDAHFG